MLNITPAKEAATMWPLAGSGMGAFACGGAEAGSSAADVAASPALPRIRRPFAAISLGYAHTGGVVGGARQISLVSTKQLNQMTRVNPVTPGGVGPHPTREPEPV